MVRRHALGRRNEIGPEPTAARPNRSDPCAPPSSSNGYSPSFRGSAAMNGPTTTSSRSAKSPTPPGGNAEPEQGDKRAAQNGTPVVHLTPEERAARGKAARSEVPRSSHAR